MADYLAKMEAQGFEELIFFHDNKTGLKGALAIHSTVLGPAVGGTRMWNYASEEEAVDDLMHLARGMSYKSAAAEQPLGGAKAVIIGDPNRNKSDELFTTYARFVQRLNGRFGTGKDMGIDEDDLNCMRKECDYIIGGEAIGSPSPYTAFGVWKGMKACMEEVNGSPSLEGKVVAVQGIGSVGGYLCQHLFEDGAKLIVTDLEKQRINQAVEEWGAKAVAPDDIYTQECDIFSPCAGGGVVNEKTLPLLKCSVIAGAANNIFKDEKLQIALKERKILYAPDYVINAGGLIFVASNLRGVTGDDEIKAETAKIEGRLKDLFRRARDEDLLPMQVADIIAEERLKIR